MLVVSEAFKRAMKQPTREISAAIVLDNGDMISSADDLINFSIERAGAPFLSAMSGFSATIIGTTRAFVGEKIQIKVRVKTNFQANTFESLNLGYFEVAEQTVNLEKGTTSIKGFDVMGEFASREYAAGRFIFPISVKNLAAEIAESSNLEFDADAFDSLPNANFEITQDLWAKISKTTFRSILDEICGATATMARITNSKLIFNPIKKQAADQISYSELRSVKFSPQTPPVNILTLSRTPQEDNITARDAEKVEADGESEIKIANNEILDKNRQELITPIFKAVKGFQSQPFEAETTGLFWFEVGDSVSIQNGENYSTGTISNIKIELSGSSLKENIQAKSLEKTKTDYKRAGGIAKTIFNTELAVDKQKQEIISMVSKATEIEATTSAQFAEMRQNLDGFNYRIEKTGGLNLLKNTAFWSASSQTGKLNFWETVGEVLAKSSQEIKTRGGISGRVVEIPAGGKLTQNITLTTGEKYSLSAKINKSPVGSAKMRILAGETVVHEAIIEAGISKTWEDWSIEDFEVPAGEIAVEFSSAEAAASLSDIMLANNSKKTPWTMAQGEIANTGVIIDEKGITVNSSINQGDTVEITPLEFAGYTNQNGTRERVFSVNKDTTEVKKLKAEDELAMTPIKIAAIKEGETTGWAFVANSKGGN